MKYVLAMQTKLDSDMLELRHAVVPAMSRIYVRAIPAVSMLQQDPYARVIVTHIHPVTTALAYMQLIRGQLSDCLLKDVHMIA